MTTSTAMLFQTSWRLCPQFLLPHSTFIIIPLLYPPSPNHAETSRTKPLEGYRGRGGGCWGRGQSPRRMFRGEVNRSKGLGEEHTQVLLCVFLLIRQRFRVAWSMKLIIYQNCFSFGFDWHIYSILTGRVERRKKCQGLPEILEMLMIKRSLINEI